MMPLDVDEELRTLCSRMLAKSVRIEPSQKVVQLCTKAKEQPVKRPSTASILANSAVASWLLQSARRNILG